MLAIEYYDDKKFEQTSTIHNFLCSYITKKNPNVKHILPVVQKHITLAGKTSKSF